MARRRANLPAEGTCTVLVLVAGASTGLGLATAAELVDDGMTSSCAPAPSRPPHGAGSCRPSAGRAEPVALVVGSATGGSVPLISSGPLPSGGHTGDTGPPVAPERNKADGGGQARVSSPPGAGHLPLARLPSGLAEVGASTAIRDDRAVLWLRSGTTPSPRRRSLRPRPRGARGTCPQTRRRTGPRRGKDA